MPAFQVVVEQPVRQIPFFNVDGISTPRRFGRNAAGHLQTTVRDHPRKPDGYLNVNLVAVGPPGGPAKMTVQVLDGNRKKASVSKLLDRRGEAFLTASPRL